MPPDEPTEEEKQQQLPQDNGTPFQPAAANAGPVGATDPLASAAVSQADDTHPSTDSGVQPQETYDQGLPTPAEPNAGNAATDYTPPQPADPSPPTDGPEGAAPPPSSGDVVAG